MCVLFFKDTATTEIYTVGHTLSLHDALPIYCNGVRPSTAANTRLRCCPLNPDSSASSARLVRRANRVFSSSSTSATTGSTGRGRSRPSDASRSEEHTSELQSLMRISYAVFCLKKKKLNSANTNAHTHN